MRGLIGVDWGVDHFLGAKLPLFRSSTHCTMVKNCLQLRHFRRSNAILYKLMPLHHGSEQPDARERVSERVNEWAQLSAWSKQAVQSIQMSEQVNGRVLGPVVTPWSLVALHHSALPFILRLSAKLGKLDTCDQRHFAFFVAFFLFFRPGRYRVFWDLPPLPSSSTSCSNHPLAQCLTSSLSPPSFLFPHLSLVVLSFFRSDYLWRRGISLPAFFFSVSFSLFFFLFVSTFTGKYLLLFSRTPLLFSMFSIKTFKRQALIAKATNYPHFANCNSETFFPCTFLSYTSFLFLLSPAFPFPFRFTFFSFLSFYFLFFSFSFFSSSSSSSSPSFSSSSSSSSLISRFIFASYFSNISLATLHHLLFTL